MKITDPIGSAVADVCAVAAASLLAGCLPVGHTYTAETLDAGENAFRMSGGGAFVAQDENPDDGTLTVLPAFTTIELGYERGLTDFLTVGATGHLGFFLGLEGVLRVRFLRAGPLQLGAVGGLVGLFSLSGSGSFASARGRLLWTAELEEDGFAFTGSGNVGVLDLAEGSEPFFGVSVGVRFPQQGLGNGVAMVSVDGFSAPAVSFCYGTDIRF